MATNTKNKHMTISDRTEIQECLEKGMTFKAIARRIGKSATTVSREVKQHYQTHSNSFTNTDDTCPLLLKAPFVCNGCEKRSRSNCHYQRRLYIAAKAQSEYKILLSEAREGIPLNRESFYETERIISSAVRNGQHIYHAIKANNISVSTATVYRHISKGYYSISALDLPRAVKFKPRRSRHIEFVPHAVKIGRSYDDYLAYMEQNVQTPVIELDTVIGRIGGKVIMTIHFVSCNFMFGLLLENKTAAEAALKIISLKNRMKFHNFNFGDIIPVILTDNGGEFSCVSAFENDLNGEKETQLFFCEPNASYEKPHIEKNHTLFRDIAPKGTSFDNFTQDTVNLIFSHVNSVARKQFNGKSAYDMFAFSYSDELAHCFDIFRIPSEQVVQSPLLLKGLL